MLSRGAASTIIGSKSKTRENDYLTNRLQSISSISSVDTYDLSKGDLSPPPVESMYAVVNNAYEGYVEEKKGRVPPEPPARPQKLKLSSSQNDSSDRLSDC